MNHTYLFPNGSILSNTVQRTLNRVFKNDDVDQLSEIIAEGIAPNSKFSNFNVKTCNIFSTNTPIISVAAYYSALQCITSLIQIGVRIDSKDFNGQTVAHFAVASGNLECTQLLSNFGVDFSDCLFIAADCGNFEMFMWLYSTQKTNLSSRKDDRTCLLHHAAKSKNMKLTNYLLKEMESCLTLSDIQEVSAMLSNSNSEYSSSPEDSDDSSDISF
ncbi:ankyrin repeat protein, putative [Trichomonas vaginalis G3]|uniref:Ankyrin repeat protein, putative n=1 Tax=Trichomonas vaginalis (strain ATCC PRA-98 / G3) TaxID=412133 RepID=A2DYN5_TRIV3|nr:Ankyrin repeat family [Trichomonas vaginalis G3]EAY14425.1 ankyrin repeat protein, putative [Trichomonas vaginalis G3]KAI5499969.1 Ankyrin repeat family [Trichomonas vaginalis G3]|eukprot:XP_001326648.1 ankyrin repeat protein [Trichomonas vaginalis G3]